MFKETININWICSWTNSFVKLSLILTELCTGFTLTLDTEYYYFLCQDFSIFVYSADVDTTVNKAGFAQDQTKVSRSHWVFLQICAVSVIHVLFLRLVFSVLIHVDRHGFRV